MTTVSIKTSGAAPSEYVVFDAKKLADACQFEVSGYPSSKADKITQEFVDKSGIVASYHSGTFLHFKISDDALDMYESL